jgi:hypothetical protein
VLNLALKTLSGSQETPRVLSERVQVLRVIESSITGRLIGVVGVSLCWCLCLYYVDV